MLSVDSQKSEDNLRQVIDTLPTLVWCTRPDGSTEFLNKRWHDYTGCSPEESRVHGWRPTVHPEDLPRVVAKGQELLASGQPGEVEARIRRRDGVFRWFLMRVEPLRDEAGKIVRWYGTQTDIDDLKQIEEKLREEDRQLRQIGAVDHRVSAGAGFGRGLLHIVPMLDDQTIFEAKDVETDAWPEEVVLSVSEDIIAVFKDTDGVDGRIGRHLLNEGGYTFRAGSHL